MSTPIHGLDYRPRYVIEARAAGGTWYPQLTREGRKGYDSAEDAISAWKAMRENLRGIDPFYPLRVVDTRSEGSVPVGPRIIRSTVATGCFYMGQRAA